MAPPAHRLLQKATPIVDGRLFFVSVEIAAPDADGIQFWSPEQQFEYAPFNADFGPVGLPHIVSFCRDVSRRLEGARQLVVCSSHDGRRRANVLLMMGAFAVLVLRWSAQRASAVVAASYPPPAPFRDASRGTCTFKCTIEHCLSGLERAVRLGWLDWQRFDVEGSLASSSVEHGDWSWLVPGRIIAFSDPDPAGAEEYGLQGWTPLEYRTVFRSCGITGVARLSAKSYDKALFSDAGFRFLDLSTGSRGEMFPDGTAPTDAVVQLFLDFTASNPGGVAVHCKAGLGRTATLVACHIIKHHGFTAVEAIAWLRMCRPGSVLGVQQHYLVDNEARLRGSVLKRARQPPPPPRKVLRSPVLRRESAGSATSSATGTTAATASAPARPLRHVPWGPPPLASWLMAAKQSPVNAPPLPPSPPAAAQQRPESARPRCRTSGIPATPVPRPPARPSTAGVRSHATV